jgi:hypothetical protein
MGRGGSVAETMDTAASNTCRKQTTPNISFDKPNSRTQGP